MANALTSPEAYQFFIYSLPEQYSQIRRSTLVYVSEDTLFGRIEGILFFASEILLCVQEHLNWELGILEGYGYEVSRPHVSSDTPEFPSAKEYCLVGYPHKDKFYWYDSFPHPNDPALAATDPHHKYVPPDIKHHRIPAPELSFTRPNLPFLITEIGQIFGNPS